MSLLFSKDPKDEARFHEHNIHTRILIHLSLRLVEAPSPKERQIKMKWRRSQKADNRGPGQGWGVLLGPLMVEHLRNLQELIQR